MTEQFQELFMASFVVVVLFGYLGWFFSQGSNETEELDTMDRSK